MSRKNRLKAPDAIFHIMCKSISEINLLKDSEDKEKYLLLVKKYKKLYNVKIYGYCLMDNHAHLLIYANGADISKVMHGINFSYAMYFNKKYERDGHLFKDRFKSLIVDNEQYLKTLSLYIHNNPTDIAGFKDCPEKYAFSSLGIYIGKKRDRFGIVDYGFVLSLFGDGVDSSRKNYYSLISGCTDEKLKAEFEFQYEETEYISGRNVLKRNITSEDIIEFISLKMNVPKLLLNSKYVRKILHAKALTIVLMKMLGDFKSIYISSVLGNITQARISKLSSIGVELISSEKKYENIIEEFIKCYAK